MKLTTLLAALLIALTAMACDEPAQEEEQEQQEEVVEEQEEAAEVDEEEVADEDAEEFAEDLAPGESGHYGAEFTVDGEPVALAAAVSELEASIEEDGDEARLDDLKIRGRIDSVCQKKGCWFTLDSEEVDLTVRIRMDDYAFFVPRNVAGGQAVIEGSLQRVVVDENMARHLAEDEGVEDLDSIEGEHDAYLIMARGISVTHPDS